MLLFLLSCGQHNLKVGVSFVSESVEAKRAAVVGSVLAVRPYACVTLVVSVESHVSGKSRFRSETESNGNQPISSQRKANLLPHSGHVHL